MTTDRPTDLDDDDLGQVHGGAGFLGIPSLAQEAQDASAAHALSQMMMLQRFGGGAVADRAPSNTGAAQSLVEQALTAKQASGATPASSGASSTMAGAPTNTPNQADFTKILQSTVNATQDRLRSLQQVTQGDVMRSIPTGGGKG